MRVSESQQRHPANDPLVHLDHTNQLRPNDRAESPDMCVLPALVVSMLADWVRLASVTEDVPGTTEGAPGNSAHYRPGCAGMRPVMI